MDLRGSWEREERGQKWEKGGGNDFMFSRDCSLKKRTENTQIWEGIVVMGIGGGLRKEEILGRYCQNILYGYMKCFGVRK